MDGPIETLLVPLDGSKLAEAATPLARLIAERAEVPLYLLRVIDPESTVDDERQAMRDLEDEARRLHLEAKPKMLVGAPADQILAEAASLSHPLIIMTTHGRSGLGRWAFGSVSDRVVHGAEAPVLLLRSDVEPPDSTGFRRILVPLDGSALAEAALPYAMALARLFAAPLHLVRVAETTRLFTLYGMSQAPIPGDVIQDMVTNLENEAHQYLDQVVERMGSSEVADRVTVLEGIPVEALLTYMTQQSIDLVVMATHGRSGFNRLVLGSVADRMLRLAHLPILMVPVTGIRARDGESPQASSEAAVPDAGTTRDG